MLGNATSNCNAPAQSGEALWSTRQPCPGSPPRGLSLNAAELGCLSCDDSAAGHYEPVTTWRFVEDQGTVQSALGSKCKVGLALTTVVCSSLMLGVMLGELLPWSPLRTHQSAGPRVRRSPLPSTLQGGLGGLPPHTLQSASTPTPPHTLQSASTPTLPLQMPSLPPPVVNECVLWGDPHVRTFDSPGRAVDFFRQGDFWIVSGVDGGNSPRVDIQGRFQPTAYTREHFSGYSAITAIAIGGSFTYGSIIIIEPFWNEAAERNGRITCDRAEILQASPSSTTCGSASIRQGLEGKLVDASAAAEQGEQPHFVHVALPLHVDVEVVRWREHLNVRITMPRIEGQDGVCGNFDGRASDAEDLKDRAGWPIPPKSLLFSSAIPFHVVDQRPHLADCPPEEAETIKAECSASYPNHESGWSACVQDRCFGGQEFAGEGLVEKY